MYILDTDHVGILQLAGGREYLALSQRIALCSQTDLYVTIVSLHEQFLGWNAYIARAKDQAATVRGYRRMERILADFSNGQVLPFDEAAGTRNMVDFERVPGLSVEDWTT